MEPAGREIIAQERVLAADTDEPDEARYDRVAPGTEPLVGAAAAVAGPAEPTGLAKVILPDQSSPEPREWSLYVYSVALTVAGLTWMMRLWRADLKIPFWYLGPAAISAGNFKNINLTGWIWNQPELGVPFGQHSAGSPSPGLLNPLLARMVSVFVGDWPAALNLYFSIGFVACAVTSVWFFRTAGVGRPLAVVSSALLALAPYHFLENENQIWLSSYFCVPLAMVLIVRAARGEALWGACSVGRPTATHRRRIIRMVAVVTGRGLVSTVILVAVGFDGPSFALFTGLLLAVGGGMALVRDGDVRRLLGVLAAEAALGGAFLLDSVPYLLRHPSGVTSPLVAAVTPEMSQLKFASLVFPSPGHPLPFFAKWRGFYDARYPLPGITPSLGLFAAGGFTLLLLMGVTALTGRAGTTEPTAAQLRRGRTLDALAVLAIAALLLSMLGGLGTLISQLAGHFSGWGNMTVFIATISTAAAALAIEGLTDRVRTALAGRRRTSFSVRFMANGVTAFVAVLVLVIGVWDQSVSGAVPGYAATKATFGDDRSFVNRIVAQVPAGSMIFQIPVVAFPSNGKPNDQTAGNQLRLWLQPSSLKWSGGGVTGRPASDWPNAVTTLPTAEMIRDLVAIGFVGITIDRSAGGGKFEGPLNRALGKPLFSSANKNYLFYSLAAATRKLTGNTTAAQRKKIAADITKGTP